MTAVVWVKKRLVVAACALAIVVLGEAEPACAGALIGVVDTQGGSEEEAETLAVRNAARMAMTERFGFSTNNPLTRAIVSMAPEKIRGHFLERPAGFIRKCGDKCYGGRLTYYLNNQGAQGMINTMVEKILTDGGIDNIAFVVMATSTAPARKLEGDQRIRISSDLSSEFGSKSTHYGVSRASAPPDLRRILLDIVRKEGNQRLASEFIADMDRLADKGSKTEEGKANIAITGFFNIYEEKVQGEGMLLSWEMRGKIIDYRTTVAVEHDLAVKGSSYGDSWGEALRASYRDSTHDLYTRQLLEKLTFKAVEKTVMVLLCGRFDLDAYVNFESALRKKVKAEIVAEKGGKAFTVLGEGITPTDVYRAISSYVKDNGWKGKIGDGDNNSHHLMVGDMDKCGS